MHSEKYKVLWWTTCHHYTFHCLFFFWGGGRNSKWQKQRWGVAWRVSSTSCDTIWDAVTLRRSKQKDLSTTICLLLTIAQSYYHFFANRQNTMSLLFRFCIKLQNKDGNNFIWGMKPESLRRVTSWCQRSLATLLSICWLCKYIKCGRDFYLLYCTFCHCILTLSHFNLPHSHCLHVEIDIVLRDCDSLTME